MTSRKRSGPSRVTVRSAWIPPRLSSSCVYTIEPTARSMSFPATPWRKAQAPGPTTSSFANDVSSNSAAAPRVARASAAIAGDQWRPAQPRGRRRSSAARPPKRGSSALGSNQLGRSQPDFSPKTAPRSARTSYVGDVRSGRPASPLLVRIVDVVVGRVVLDRSGEGVRPATDTPRRTAGCPSSRGRARARLRRSSSPSAVRCHPRRRCRGPRSRRPPRSPERPTHRG